MNRVLAALVTLTALSLAQAGGGMGGVPPLAPNFTLTDLGGQRVALRDLRGQVVIVLFGDVHCATCRKNDALLRLYQYQYMDRGLAVVSLHEHVTPQELAQYDGQFAFSTLTGQDVGERIARRYHARSIPMTVFIDQGGRVRDVVYGALDEARLLRDLQQLL